MGPGVKRIEQPTIQNGIAVFPHEQGVRAVFGVPQLQPQHSVTLDKAMVLEVEMGCMRLGLYSEASLDSISSGTDLFATNGSWRSFVGPDYMEDVLGKAVDDIRALYQPLYNESSLDSDGFMVGINSSLFQESTTANVMHTMLNMDIPDSNDQLTWIKGNCTASLRSRLNLTEYYPTDAPNYCNMFGLGGSIISDGALYVGLSRFVCAAATQVNMASVTISSNADGTVNPINMTRLPADLNHVRASFFDVMQVNNGQDTQYTDFVPYDRFTLSDNPDGETSHYITHSQDFSSIRVHGTGSGGGSAMTRVASLMIDDGLHLGNDPDTATLTVLNDGNDPITFNVSRVTTWGGEVGASYILTSLAYNGWAAENHDAVLVRSTGGKLGTCYSPPYALGFLPLVLAALIVIAWALYLLLTSHFTGLKNLEYLYGGMTPFWGVVSSHTDAEHTILGWENHPKPHLQLLIQGQPLVDGETAVRYVQSGSMVEKN
ncbi:hypothetical protein K435DRAFT_780587 [Dendrothele bispora CBS 962.96]|uniref:Uncharacterized protein n=1 Tax=Dendrothele bispora (strain CBS 962.96) TaxID=1314807 RepID=A0A4S8LQI3_DENBC|nr:hypothetical protein K435DRAFT_780587 [Dendrothele bispora CBS 962.96]